MRIDTDLRVPAADGSMLATDLYLPEDAHALVIVRTPYDRAALRRDGLGWARAGIAALIQDVRGRYGSTGSWRPYAHERADAAALLSWLARQPWTPDHVVAVGASYAAWTAWALALEGVDRVHGVISMVPATGIHAVNHSAGILRLAEHVTWWSEHGQGPISRTALPAAALAADPGLYHRLPVRELGAHLGFEARQWWPVVSDDPAEHPWQPEVVDAESLRALSIASLHIGGWYDPFLPATLDQWRQVGADAPRRPARRLIVGPWAHALSSPHTATVGDRHHGPDSRLPLGRVQVQWVRDLLDGNPPTGESLYPIGASGWQSWPSSAPTCLWPAPDGTLTGSAVVGVTRDYRYDPRDPYPSSLPGHAHTPGTRADTLRFTLPRQHTPLRVIGTPVLHLVTSAPVPADRVALLIETTADGTEFVLADTAASLPAGRHRATLTFAPVAVEIPTTSTLTLLLTGGWFPALARHPQTDENRYRATTLAPATHTVQLGATRLQLPLAKG